MADNLELELKIRLEEAAVLNRLERAAIATGNRIEASLSKSLKAGLTSQKINIDTTGVRVAIGHIGGLNKELRETEKLLKAIGLNKLRPAAGGGSSSGSGQASKQAQKEASDLFRTNSALTKQRIREEAQALKASQSAHAEFMKQRQKDAIAAQNAIASSSAKRLAEDQAGLRTLTSMEKEYASARMKAAKVGGDNTASRQLQHQIKLQQESIRHAQTLSKIKASPISPTAARDAEKLAHAINGINVKRLNDEFKGLQKSSAAGTAGLGAGVAAGVTSAVTSLGLSAVGAAVAAPIAFTEDSIAKAMEYNSALTMIKVNTKATEAQMKAIGTAVLEASSKFGILPAETANLALGLGRMGVSAKAMPEYLDAIGASARATGEDFNTVKDVIAQTKSVFSELSVGDVGDILTVAANQSPKGFQGIGMALSYVGSSAAAARVPLTDLIEQIVILQTAGIDDSTAGTQLRRLFTDIKENAGVFNSMGVEVYDSTGKIRQMADIISDTSKKIKGMTDEQKALALTKLDTLSVTALETLSQQYEKNTAKIKENRLELQAASKEDAAASQAKAAFTDPSLKLRGLLADVDILKIKLGEAFLPGADAALTFGSAMVEALLGSEELFQGIEDAANDLKGYLEANPQLVQEFADGLTEAAQVLSTQIGTEAKQLVEYLKENPKAIGEMGAGMVEFARNLATVVSAAAELINLLTTVTQLASNLGGIAGVGGGLPFSLSGIQSAARGGMGLLQNGGTNAPASRAAQGTTRPLSSSGISFPSGSLDQSALPPEIAPKYTGDRMASTQGEGIEVAVSYKGKSPKADDKAFFRDKNAGDAKNTSDVTVGGDRRKSAAFERTIGRNFSTNADLSGGAQSVSLDDPAVKTAISFYLGLGFSQAGAAYMVGNLIQESNLDPTAVGDNGAARGLSQVVGDRQRGLPSGFKEQLAFVPEEFERDTPGITSAFRGNDIDAIRAAIRGAERYGIEGARFEHGANLLSQLQSRGNPSAQELRAAAPSTPFVPTMYGVDQSHYLDDSPVGAYDFTLNQPGAGNDGYDAAIPSPVPGRVTDVGNEPGYGNYVSVQGEDGITWFFAHFKETFVKIGDEISEGMHLGLQGTTGNSTGEHIHLELTDDAIGGMGNQIQDRSRTRPLVDDYLNKVRSGVYGTGGASDGQDVSERVRQARANVDEATRLKRETQDRQFNSDTEVGRVQLETQTRSLTGTEFEGLAQQKLEAYDQEREHLQALTQAQRDLTDLEAERGRLEARRNEPNIQGVIAETDAAIAQQKAYIESLDSTHKAQIENRDAARLTAIAQEDAASRSEMAQRNAQAQMQGLSLEVQRYVAMIKDSNLGGIVQQGFESTGRATEFQNQADGVRDEIQKIEKELAILQGIGIGLNDPQVQSTTNRLASLRDLLTTIEENSNIQIQVDSEQRTRIIEQFREDNFNSLSNARADNLRRNGDEFGANRIQRTAAQREEVLNYAQRRVDLEGARSTLGDAVTDEQIGVATAEHGERLAAIADQYKTLGETARDAGEEMVGSFAQSLIAGEDFGKAFESLIKGLIDQLAQLASKLLMTELFGNGESSGLFGGGSKGDGMGSVLSTISSGLGLFFGGGGGGGGGLNIGIGESLIPAMYDGNLNSIPNYAAGVDSAFRKERMQSGSKPYLAVLNQDEIVLSKSQSEKFRELGLQNLVTLASGNMPAPSMGQSITIPMEFNLPPGESAPDPRFEELAKTMEKRVKATAASVLAQSSRPNGSLWKRGVR
jgi:TP901 family phage tail tape measure protein